MRELSEAPKVNYIKSLAIGASFAVLWLMFFVLSGTIWSITHTSTLGFGDHFYNGFAFAKMMNLLSLFIVGFSIGIDALYYLSKDMSKNLKILGFVLTHICIVGSLWMTAPLDFKRDPLSDRMIDRVNELGLFGDK